MKQIEKPALSAKDRGRSLPIWQQKDAILQALAKHRVVIIDGPPGCGKTTQLPQMLQEAGLVPRRMGITQPRRIAAIGVASRLCDEMHETLGEGVGYAIRFDDTTSAHTSIKVMTDGILLQETRADKALSSYDIIMVDEVHERSLNIDFTLGLLLQALSLRSDLRVLISSATLPPGQMQHFFAPVEPAVPVVRVHHRQFPVHVRYAEPPVDTSPDELAFRVAEEVGLVLHEVREGHVLVFLPGEGTILKAQALIEADGHANVVVLPLFGRLSQNEQALVFDEFSGQRKVILATNIAETSITIDGVRAVVDSGLQKLPYFHARTGVTALHEQWVSRASAEQRAGRAGRTGPGEVVRLYPERTFVEMDPFGREEMLRIDLSEAVLRLIDLGIRDVEQFPLPTAPPRGKLRAALEHLMLLGAIDMERQLTPVGRRMVPFPLTPALARMVVEAIDRYPEATGDVLIVSAMLSMRSPFLYPRGFEEEARSKQRFLKHPRGDALTMLNVFRRYVAAPSGNAFSREHYLDADGLSFAVRAHAQLVDIAKSRRVQVQEAPAKPEAVLRCVLAGFCDKLLQRDMFDYVTTTDVACTVHPSSAMFGTKERFLVANELVQLGHRTQIFGVNAVLPEWIREGAPDAARAWGLTRSGLDKRRQERVASAQEPASGRRRPDKGKERRRRGKAPKGSKGSRR